MAKYIGTYANENAIASAITNNELNRPFVALANDTKRVYYGEYADLAQIGDIVVYDSARTSLRFIHFADYNTTTYPTASYEPVGVVCEDQVISLAGGKSDVKMVGKMGLRSDYPDGSIYRTGIQWGPRGTTTNATSTTDGKANTELVLTFATGQPDWRTASTISYTDGERMFPLFECAWRYHTAGTNQGDWYIGAQNEIMDFINILTVMNNSIVEIGGTQIPTALWSSTEGNADNGIHYENAHETMMFDLKSKAQSDGIPFYKGTILPM